MPSLLSLDRRAGVALCLAVGLLSACVAALPLRGVLRSRNVEYAVEGRSSARFLHPDAAFRFGAYRVTPTHDARSAGVTSSTSTRGSEGLTVLGQDTSQLGVETAEGSTAILYRFARGEAVRWLGRCSGRSSSTRADVGGGTSIEHSEEHLVCSCGGEAAAARLEISGRPGAMSGVATAAGQPYRIAGDVFAGGETPYGYYITRDSVDVAAVDVLTEGRVWFSPDLPPDEVDALACLTAALLLQAG